MVEIIIMMLCHLKTPTTVCRFKILEAVASLVAWLFVGGSALAAFSYSTILRSPRRNSLIQFGAVSYSADLADDLELSDLAV
jgi:hypothetical protein